MLDPRSTDFANLPRRSEPLAVRRDASRGRGAVLCLLVLVLAATSLRAELCTVPGSHPTLQAAIDDASCDPIELEAGDYSGSPTIDRSLTVDGPGSAVATLWGRLEVSGSGVDATVAGLEIWSACPGPAVESAAGARLSSSDLPARKTTAGACHEIQRVFRDGFESGSTEEWSAVSP